MTVDPAGGVNFQPVAGGQFWAGVDIPTSRPAPKGHRVKATILSDTRTVLKIKVPGGAKTGKIKSPR